MKKILKFFFLLLLSYSATAQQETYQNELIAAESATYPFGTTGGRISVSMRYNTHVYEDYTLKLTLPSELYTPSIDGGSEQVRLTKIATTPVGDNYEITFAVEVRSVTPCTEDNKDICYNSINIPFYNFAYYEGCSVPIYRDVLFDLKARKTDSPNSPFEDVPQAKTTVTFPGGNVNNLQPTITLTHNPGDTDAPFYYHLILNGVQSLNKIRVAMSYDKDDFDFIKLTRYNDNAPFNESFGLWHWENISTTIEDDSLIFEIDNTTIKENSYQFMIYLRPENNASIDPENKIKVSIRENDPTIPLESNTECGTIKRYQSLVYEAYGQISYIPGTYKPGIKAKLQNNTYNVCNSLCNKKRGNSIFVEANNSFINSSSTKSIRINMRQNTKVISLRFFDQYSVPASGFTIKYKPCGQSQEIATSFNTIHSNGNILSVNESVEYILVENMPLAAYSANDFEVLFEDDVIPASCGYSDKFEIGYVGESMNIYASTVSVSEPCEVNKRIEDHYLPGLQFDGGQEGFVRIALKPATLNGNIPGVYTFNNIEYKLDSKMSFTSDALKFYIGTNSDPQFEDFKPLNEWIGNAMVEPGFSVVKLPITLNNKVILINNVQLKNTCEEEVKFFILAKVKTSAKLPYKAEGYKSRLTMSDPTITEDLKTWNNRGSFILKTNTYLFCNKENSGNSNVRLGETVAVNYVMENAGPEKMKDFTIVFQKLSINSLELTPEPTGKLYLFNDNNVRTLSNGSIAITDTIITFENEELPGYSRLELVLYYQIPSGLQYVNKTATTSFKAGGKGMDNTASNIVKSNVLQLTITQSYSFCSPVSCSECITSFSPQPGHRYLLSAWVKEPLTDVTKTFRNTGIRITFNNGELSSEEELFRPSGPIIDGWQRIEKAFWVPADATSIQIELVNNSEHNKAYFDDIRIHPFKSNMKSFVYDQYTQKLVAELDENNYATYYEYDDEGILIRVKKETERGVMTIKESRNNQSKIFKDK